MVDANASVTLDRPSGKNRTSLVGFAWSLLIEVPPLVTGFVTFATLVFLLEPELYGQIGTLVAVAAIVGPISTFGATWRLLQRVVTSANPKKDLGLAVVVVVVGTVSAACVSMVVSPLVVGSLIDSSTTLVFLLAQVTGLWLIELAVTYTVGVGRLPVGAAIRVSSTIFRVGAVAVFAIGADHSVQMWVWHMGVSTLLAVGAAYIILEAKTDGSVKLSVPSLDEFATGLSYSLSSTTEGFLAASDRPILQRSGFAAATGTYSAGYRIVTLAFVPLLAWLKAQDRRLFAAGAEGIRPAYIAGKRIARSAAALMAAVSLLVLAMSPLLESALAAVRPEYRETANVVAWLSVLPFIKSIQFSFGNVLTAAKKQQTRLRLTLAATATNLIGNLIFIPIGSWRAAVATTLVAEVVLAGLVWRACVRIVNSEGA